MVFGAVFLLVGALGFTATGMHMGMDMSAAPAPLLLGLFPVNALHNVVHLLFGAWGVWAARSAGRSLAYAFGSGAAYMALAILGMITPTLLGIVPIGGYDVVLHLAVACVLAGCGFWAMWFAPRQPVAQSADAPQRRAA
jgi:hypothetical protein